MTKKIIVVILGIGLIFVGIILAAPTLAELLSALFKGYGFEWPKAGVVKLLFGTIIMLCGFVVLFIGLLKRVVFWFSLLGVFIFIAGAGGFLSYGQVMEINAEVKSELPKINKNTGIVIEIPFNANTNDIAELLKENGVIKKTAVFKLLSKINGFDGTYQAGTHYVTNDLNYNTIMRILGNKPESIRVSIPEGLTYTQIVDRLVEKKLINRENFEKVAKEEKFENKFLQSIPERSKRLEGYLFPDTYEFAMKAGEKTIIKAMLDNFDKKFTSTLTKRAQELKMTTDQIIILASIIERESMIPEDRRKIASVFYKRLSSKDPTLKKLQSCATIQYIYLNKEGTVKKTITTKDTEIEDPYNTYKYEGLPPGPICSPGLDSIDAALNPAKGDYLYFVARGDGTSEFSTNYKDHTNAAKKYGVIP